MSAGDYVLGVMLFALVAVAAAWVSIVVVRSRLAHLDRLEGALAGGLIGIAVLLAIHLVPLTLGVLSRGTVVISAALAAAAGLYAWRGSRPGTARATDASDRPRAASGTASWGIAGVAAAAWMVAFAANVREWLPRPLIGIDTQTFHLPNAARWMETGSLWQIDQFIPLQAHGYYPNHGDVLLLAGMLPWNNDFFVRVPMVLLLLAFPVALWACARELGAPPAAGLVVSLVVSGVPALGTSVAPRAMPDVLLCFALAVALLFLLRHGRTGMRSDLVIAGLGLGVALGTKWYGLSTAVVAIAVVAVVWLVAARRRGSGSRAPVADTALLGGVTLAVGGIWMLRNVVEVANPFFPLKLAPFGVTIFDAPRDIVSEQVGFSILDYLGDPDVLLGDIPGEIHQGLGFAPVALGLAVLIAIAVGVRSRQSDRRPLALLAAVLLLAAAYVATPNTALGLEGQPTEANFNTRYLLPALIAAVPVVAWAAGRIGRAAVVLEAVMALVVLANLRDAFAPFSAGRAVGAAVVLGALAAAVLAATRMPAGRRRLIAGAAAAAVVVAAAAYGWRVQDSFNAVRYADDGEPTIVSLSRAADTRPVHVALAGNWNARGTSPVWASFGERVDGRVSVIGYDADGFLTNYDDPGRFRTALAAEAPDLLVVGRGLDPRPGVVPREERWAASAGWRATARSERFVLMERR